jgi:hypothetical protein
MTLLLIVCFRRNYDYPLTFPSEWSHDDKPPFHNDIRPELQPFEGIKMKKDGKEPKIVCQCVMARLWKLVLQST